MAVSLSEGAVRDGDRPLRHRASSLALGQRGWIQAGNFAMAGTLFLAGAAGLARVGDPAASRAAPALIGAALASSWRSWRAGQHRFGIYSAGTAVAMLTTMALAGAGFGQSPRLINLGGLFQRASIITGFAWLTALSAQALRRTPATAAPRHQAG